MHPHLTTNAFVKATVIGIVLWSSLVGVAHVNQVLLGAGAPAGRHTHQQQIEQHLESLLKVYTAICNCR